MPWQPSPDVVTVVGGPLDGRTFSAVQVLAAIAAGELEGTRLGDYLLTDETDDEDEPRFELQYQFDDGWGGHHNDDDVEPHDTGGPLPRPHHPPP